MLCALSLIADNILKTVPNLCFPPPANLFIRISDFKIGYNWTL